MLISYKRGQGSIILRVKILNSSVSTGAGLTGLTFSSSGLIISTIADNEASPTAYTQAGSTIEDITTLGTFAAPTATKCRFKEVHSTNHKGVYEIQIADARFAVSSAKSLIVSISGVTNLAETDVCVPLTDTDPYNATTGGMAALPAFAAGADGGLPVLSSGGTTLAYTVTTVTAVTGLTASDVAAIKAKTDNLPSDPADQSLIIAATNAILAIMGTPAVSLAADIGEVPDLTWDVVLASHLTAGSTGEALDNAGGAAADPWNTALPGAYAVGTAGYIVGNMVSAVGPGSISVPVEVIDISANPLDGAACWVSTDEAGDNVIAGPRYTNASGLTTFLLDAGSYYLWVTHAGFNGTNPTAFVVS